MSFFSNILKLLLLDEVTFPDYALSVLFLIKNAQECATYNLLPFSIVHDFIDKKAWNLAM